MKKRALILGATGAMATYLVPKLIKNGYYLDGVCVEDAISDDPSFNLMVHDAKDIDFLKELLKNNYDVLVDFMVYDTLDEFKKYYKMYLDGAKHYIFLSTYRVYAGEYPLTEESPRLVDIELPADYTRYKEYSIYKGEEEDFLRSTEYKNYTIIRPAITYSRRRFQLTVLEANVILHRMKAGKVVLLPEGARDKMATMSWAGDVADMIYAIIGNKRALCETYTVSTAEHNTWEDVAKMYNRIGGLRYKFIPTEDFLNIVAPGNVYGKQQLMYDRCFNRVVDNTKILKLMGATQAQLMPLEDGLRLEYERVDMSKIPFNKEVNARMDEYIAAHKIK